VPAFLTQRWTEFRLLVICELFLCLGLASLDRSGVTGAPILLPLALEFALIFAFAHAGLRLLAPGADELLLPLTALFSAFGIIFVTRLQPELAGRQVIWLAVGVGLLLICLGPLRSFQRLRHYQYVAAFAGLALMFGTALFGEEVNGSRLWLGFHGFYFQVTEAMKVLLVLFLAGYLADRRLLLSGVSRQWRVIRVPSLAYLLPLSIIWALTLGLMAWQHDLGAMLLLMGVTLLMLYAATSRLTYVIGGLIVVILNIYLAYHLFGYVRLRIDLWLHPLTQVHGAGYQVAQALYAFAAGGVFGTGLGHGSPGYIPAVHTDFIFAAIGEELGLSGAMALLAGYLLFAFRGLRIAESQPTEYGTLLALGCTAILALQSLIIMAGNLALIPITGITLPFVSYGGSSIAVNFILVAALLRLSDQRPALARRDLPAAELSAAGDD
jgi:cell division protein FtsW (lipid II flippase)